MVFILKLLRTILGLTLYDMMQLSHDFEDVKAALNDRIDCYFFMCALSPTELKERADQIGYATFAILFAVLDIGFVIVRVAGFVALSGSPALAVGLVFVTMSPFAILPVLTYPARLLKRRKQELTEEAKLESGTMVDGIQT
ncbi:hypothetical protein L210DRAFT_2123841 [Boletus edulis BED1]|uniref:Uncharacterized protein n=1 Tax=Boletus edulis BED1 TaxID=1328754 RepID=A0AAD4BWG1_BOLED|nr:hypothetical protein L210DRAFT_2123841 [Boletus edulis BED1]